ncbi:Glycoside hydrolase [Canna indica]|uniref:cellulase n=1 Tax=Canna indica TaxID=4628 RepID=A0AAQ3KPY4_9LILI|nr:Glycoside hydrolase [Canna indica]
MESIDKRAYIDGAEVVSRHEKAGDLEIEMAVFYRPHLLLDGEEIHLDRLIIILPRQRGVFDPEAGEVVVVAGVHRLLQFIERETGLFTSELRDGEDWVEEIRTTNEDSKEEEEERDEQRRRDRRVEQQGSVEHGGVDAGELLEDLEEDGDDELGLVAAAEEAVMLHLVGGMVGGQDLIVLGLHVVGATMLSWSVLEFEGMMKGEIVNAKGEHVGVCWATNYLLKATTHLNTIYVQVGDASKDHACWERPEDMDTPRRILKVDTNNPSSDIAVEIATALAVASLAFRKLTQLIPSFFKTELYKYSSSLTSIEAPTTMA